MNDYRGLKSVLYVVRLSQHYTAVVAEVLILLAFAMSGLDVSLGGKLAAIPGLAVMWGIAFAIGIDTSFVLAWVRIRQVIASKNFGHLWYAIPLAVGMSFIVFQPVAIQQLQQSMGIGFNAALANLGIDLNFLVYARSLVAVLLGAILAMTNVERSVEQQDVQVERSSVQVERSGVQFVQAGVYNEQAVVQMGVQAERSIEQPGVQVSIPERSSVQPTVQYRTPEQKLERVRTLLLEQPGVSVRSVAQQLDMPVSTANGYMKRVKEVTYAK